MVTHAAEELKITTKDVNFSLNSNEVNSMV